MVNAKIVEKKLHDNIYQTVRKKNISYERANQISISFVNRQKKKKKLEKLEKLNK